MFTECQPGNWQYTTLFKHVLPHLILTTIQCVKYCHYYPHFTGKVFEAYRGQIWKSHDLWELKLELKIGSDSRGSAFRDFAIFPSIFCFVIITQVYFSTDF